MPDFINLRLIDSKIMDLLSDIVQMRGEINKFATNPTDNASDSLVASVEKASVSFESVKYALANTVKEASLEEDETEIVGTLDQNGIKLT